MSGESTGDLNHGNLIWQEQNSKKVFDCGIFSIRESRCKSPANDFGNFMVIDAADWAIIIPVIKGPGGEQFVMVRQWRHGSQSLSLEFPGGVFEPGENPPEAAARELREETGYRPLKIEKIGEFSPNPAIMSNRVHFFLAEELENTGKQSPDDDEYLEVVLADVAEVRSGMGRPPYIHALMGAALSLYDNLQQPGSRAATFPAGFRP